MKHPGGVKEARVPASLPLLGVGLEEGGLLAVGTAARVSPHPPPRVGGAAKSHPSPRVGGAPQSAATGQETVGSRGFIQHLHCSAEIARHMTHFNYRNWSTSSH